VLAPIFCKELYSQTQGKHGKKSCEHPYQWQWTLHRHRRSTHDRGNEANQEGATTPATSFYYLTYARTIGRTNCSSEYLPLIQEIVDTEGGSDCEMPSRALHLG
jgi:hypothetical protein